MTKPKVECAVCGKPQHHAVHSPTEWDHDFQDSRRAGLQGVGKAKERFNRSPVGREYNARTAALKDGQTPCQIQSPVCTGVAEHQHEVLTRGRAGGIAAALRDGPPTVYACDPCNGYVSENVIWARERGYILSRRELT